MIKRITTALLIMMLFLPLTVNAVSSPEKPVVGWTANELTAGNWQYYSRDNTGTVVSRQLGDTTKLQDNSLFIRGGEPNRYGGTGLDFVFSFIGNKADTWANVGITVEIDLDAFRYLYFELDGLSPGASVGLNLDETFAGKQAASYNKNGQYKFDLLTVYPEGGMQRFWVNFCIVCPSRDSHEFRFPYIMIGNATADEYDENAYERTVEPWAFDFELQKKDFVYYGKNDEGAVLQQGYTTLGNRSPIIVEGGDDAGYPGSSATVEFKWPDGSQADWFQRLGIIITVDLDDTPFLYVSCDFGKGDWLAVGAVDGGFDDSGAYSDTDKSLTGARVCDLRSHFGGGIKTLRLVISFGDQNFDGSLFTVNYLYFGNRSESPDKFVAPVTDPVTEPATDPTTDPVTAPPSDTCTDTVTDSITDPAAGYDTHNGTTQVLWIVAAIIAGAGVVTVILAKKRRKLLIIGVILIAVAVCTATALLLINPPIDVQEPAGTDEITRAVFTPTENSGSRLHVSVIPFDTDIIRETPDGDMRLIYLKITNPDGLAAPKCVLRYGEGEERRLCEIYANEDEVSDTVWIGSDFEGLLEASVKNGETELWSGTLAISKAPETCYIEQSHCMTLDEIPSGSVRGVNYFNREYCWGKDWSEDDFTAEWDADFADMTEKLHINAARAFTIWSHEDMFLSGGLPCPDILMKLDAFLGVADKYGVKIILCLNSGFYPGYSEKSGENLRFIRAVTEMFNCDGRILAFDLANEIDCADALAAEIETGENGTLSRYITEMYPLLRDETAPNHITMIGTGFKLYNLKTLGIVTECGSYHGYIQTDVPADRVADSYTGAADEYFNGKDGAWLLEEWGFSSEDSYGTIDETYQASAYESYIGAIKQVIERGYRLLGGCQWCAYDYTESAKIVVVERYNGAIRTDGTLKPGGELLAAYYTELARNNPAPWDK